MTHIMKMCWEMNKDDLRKKLAERTDLNECNYIDLVSLTFGTIYNSYITAEYDCSRLDLSKITEIDNGDYQGTLIFMIPFETYQPGFYEYIMTYIGYGSCSGCDALLAAQDCYGDDKLTDQQVVDFMAICKDLVCNAIRPYNRGWYEAKEWNAVEEDI